MTRRQAIRLALASSCVVKATAQSCSISYPAATYMSVPRAVSGFQLPVFPGANYSVGYGYQFKSYAGQIDTRIDSTTGEIVPVYAYDNCHRPIYHPGVDLNYNKNPMSSWDDYGLPVQAVADGLVVYVRPSKPFTKPKETAPLTYGQWLAYRNTLARTSPSGLLSSPPPAALADTELMNDSKDWIGVVIQHFYLGKFYYSLYGHIIKIDRNAVVEKQPICKGTVIGQVGCVGANNPHLHLELRNEYWETTNRSLSYRPWNNSGFCEAGSDAYVSQRYLSPETTIAQRPPYDTIISSEVEAWKGADARFGTRLAQVPPVESATAATNYHEIRKFDYSFSGNRTVRVYHYLNARDETQRSIGFLDPDLGGFVYRQTPKLD